MTAYYYGYVISTKWHVDIAQQNICKMVFINRNLLNPSS